MKFLVVILSVYFLGLNLMPCQDEPATEDSAQLGMVEMYSAGQDHGPCSSDLCSPFCGCHCCHVHVLYSLFIPPYLVQSFYGARNFTAIDLYKKDNDSNMLRPPRLIAIS
ncbi:MAG: DUF6660 family protein [Pricia sp.]